MAGSKSPSSEKTETKGYQTPITDNEKAVTKIAEAAVSVPSAEENHPPQLQPLSDQPAHPGKTVAFTAFAMDPDNDPITYALVSGPPGATMAGANFSWIPNWSQLGAWTVTIRASDPGGLSDTRSCIITVGNQAPQLQPLMDMNGHPGRAISFTVFAMDPDNDTITYTLVSGPPGATLNGNTFSWTPNWNQLGDWTVTIRATDPGGLSDTKSCTIHVLNQAPQLQPLSNLTAHPGMVVSFTAFAMDPDGDQVSYNLVSGPPGATMNLNNFSWTPNGSQLGAWTVTVRATDPGLLSDTRSCTITVTA